MPKVKIFGMNQRFSSVDSYIKAAPKEAQPSLKQLRRLIQSLAPKSAERISYGMPYYEHKGRLAYFANMKGYIGLYIPPPIVANHAKELKNYVTTKSAVHLPIKKLPVALITKLIKARMKWNQTKIT